MELPCFPRFVPLSLDMKSELYPALSMTADGVSEFTFVNLYLFRNRYRYRVCRSPGTFVISGEREGKKFFMTPCTVPVPEVLEELFRTHDYWKGISDSVLGPCRAELEAGGIEFTEDRDNFDYLFLRADLADLAGKKFHKKRNLVNAFINAYRHEERPLSADLVPQAAAVLDRWREDKGAEGDYAAAREALEIFGAVKMRGTLYYVNGRPAGWCLGERIARGRMFAIHFEKAIDEYKGIYQFMNQSFAAALPRHYTWINREQDLGDEGLRQSKTTWRPCGFVRKYLGRRADKTPGILS